MKEGIKLVVSDATIDFLNNNAYKFVSNDSKYKYFGINNIWYKQIDTNVLEYCEIPREYLRVYMLNEIANLTSIKQLIEKIQDNNISSNDIITQLNEILNGRS
jgi:hypothetical protein